MTQALPKTKLVTFEEFVNWKPDGGRYELHDGVIVKMPQPLGDREEIVGFSASELNAEYRRLNLPYRRKAEGIRQKAEGKRSKDVPDATGFRAA